MKYGTRISKGFIVEVNPSGRKTFIFRYYDKYKKRQKLKIGVFGNITCEIAREITQGLAGDIARGIDPKQKKFQKAIEEKKSINFSQFFCLFTEKYRNIHHAKSTLNRDEYRIKLHILPFFGQNTLSKITVRDILNFKDLLKHIPGTFNKCFTLLHKAFALAELWEYREKNSNPCHGVQKYPERKMERFLKKDELRRLEEIIKLEEIYRLKSPYVLAAIRILIYTGCRMGEILTLKWEDIHLEENYIHIKKSKTGEKIVPLNKASKNVIKAIEKQEGNPYVFCSEKPGTHVVNIQESWRNIRKSVALSDVRIHDLRHSFASFAINNGLDLFQVSKLLGHKNIQTTMRYAHITKENLIKSANIVGEVFGE
jgi:integrase